jgi:hypothetical protein
MVEGLAAAPLRSSPRYRISIRTMGFQTRSAKEVPPVSVFLTRTSQRGPGFLDAAVVEGLEEAVEIDLGLAFFIAGDVLGAPVGELGEEGFPGEIHAGMSDLKLVSTY